MIVDWQDGDPTLNPNITLSRSNPIVASTLTQLDKIEDMSPGELKEMAKKLVGQIVDYTFDDEEVRDRMAELGFNGKVFVAYAEFLDGHLSMYVLPYEDAADEPLD